MKSPPKRMDGNLASRDKSSEVLLLVALVVLVGLVILSVVR